MPQHIVAISGSPQARSRSTALLQLALARLEQHDGDPGWQHVIHARELPAASLLGADREDADIVAALAAVQAADLVVVATPIYKAAYSGLLKTFLDLLPQDGLRGKTVLPLATGGSAAHLLALDYALRPVLAALGARHILDGVFATDAQLLSHETGYLPEPALVERIDRALEGRPVETPAPRCRPAAAAALAR
ncbi:MAG: NADPH-dependent FMN reductase [Pelomonas sp.]|nr:NADPH-dependent FMN reductase [Roseateles sp.]